MIDVDPEHEGEFNEWYEKEHLPERVTAPGFLSARRFVAVQGEPKYLALYDLDSPEAIESPEYKKINTPSEWTKKIRAHYRKFVRNVYVELVPDPHGMRRAIDQE
ncbi:MAG: DUF4286 family protein [Hyphomonadaceae bacterium]|nr:DUF4286 family protein [Hyphomonadaceae bacterium]